MSGHDLLVDGQGHRRGALLRSVTSGLVERLPHGSGRVYANKTMAAAYSKAGNAQTLVWSEPHPVRLQDGQLISCQALYATTAAGGPGQPLYWSDSGAFDHLDAAVGPTGNVALAYTDDAPLHADIRAVYAHAGKANGFLSPSAGQLLPLKGVEIVKVATRGNVTAVAAAGRGRLEVYVGPFSGPLRRTFAATNVDAAALDIALTPARKVVLAFSRGGRLHLLRDRTLTNTNYPAYGAGMTLSANGAVAHLAWSLKPTAAPCRDRRGMLYDCAGKNGLLGANTPVTGGGLRNVRRLATFADAVAPQVLVGPRGMIQVAFVPSTSRSLSLVRSS